LCKGRIVFDQLFLTGIFAAFAASVHCSITGVGHVYYEVVAILVAIYTFGGLLTETRRREAIEGAGDFGREFAWCEVEAATGIERVAVNGLREGAVVRVAPGGAICVDGTVLEGTSFVQEATLTGEPFPVVRRAGDRVLAGSVALDGALRIRSRGGPRQLDALLDALREARARPTRLQRQADRLASWFLPAVVVVAVATFVVWTMRAGWSEGLFNALAVILVACPCAMGIATPVGIWSAMGRLARLGLLVRDPDVIEKLAGITRAVFDKTGTLGEDALVLVDLVTAPGVDREMLQARAAALEATSEHPVARAFHSATARAGELQKVEVVAGAGLRGCFAEGELGMGNEALFDPSLRLEWDALLENARRPGQAGERVIYLGWNGRPVAVAILAETLRQGAREALATFSNLGIPTEVMTGDRTASALAHGLDGVQSGLLPAEKAARVRDLQARGERVLFVGDGVNDAAALAEADAGIAMVGGAGVARAAADAELAGGDLRSVARACVTCRDAVSVVRGNLRFAALYNCIGIALAACGFLHPVAASVLMLLSSFTVTWRAMREVDEPREFEPPALKEHGRHGLAGRSLAASWLAAVAGGAVLLQGVAVVLLGSFRGATATGLLALFAVAAAGLAWFLSRRPMSGETRHFAWMLSAGGLAMLAGWWADAGFAPAVRDGICLCGCPDSTYGLRFFVRLNWMDAGMVMASLPMLAVAGSEGRVSRWLPWLAGLVGMLGGMRAASLLSSYLSDTQPQVAFFAGYGAMVFGMVLGMMFACGVARRLRGGVQ
jgi:Cu2+-exporting ATPase/Cu+-exporting ATPase